MDKTMQALSNEGKMLLALMRAALRGTFDRPVDWDAACSAEALEEMILRQSLVNVVYPVIQRQTGAPWERLKHDLKPMYEREIHKAVTQEYEIQLLLDAMERDGIDCLPMKGWVMRRFYPDPLMRSMSDFDLLIRDMDSRQMESWMKKQGYTPERVDQETHDVYYKPPYMNIELHRRMLDPEHLSKSESEWADKHLQTLWNPEKRLPEKKHIYGLTNEDFYIYHISHFYKHFTGSGAGIRLLADTWLFQKEKGETLDRTYLEKQLEALHILEFSKRMGQAAAACFDGKARLDKKDELVAAYLTSEGVYGSLETHEALQVLGRGKGSFASNKVQTFVKRVMPPWRTMKNRYPRLSRYPWLLPFYWGIRAGRILFLEPYKVERMMQNQTREEYDALKKVYEAAGVMDNLPSDF